MGRKKDLTLPEDKKLSRRQEKFVKELVAGDGLIGQRESAIRAGFPASSAHTRAYEMMRLPHVAKAIAEYRAELDAQYAVNYKRSERDLKLIGQAALDAGAYSASVQAEIARGKLAGLYTHKSEIRTGSIDALSREEVELELEKIRRSFGTIIDVTPEEETPEVKTHRSGAVAASEDGAQDDEPEDRADPAGEPIPTGDS